MLKLNISILVFCLSYLFLIKISFAQKAHPFSVETRLHYGFIIPHHKDMRYIIKGHVPALELIYNNSTYGKHQWEQIYNYPEWGISFFYADLANPEYLGIATGIYPFIKFSLLKKKKFQINYRIGAGAGWVSKSFDRVENYKNVSIGSKGNIIIGNIFTARWSASDRITLSTGMGITHFSNGSYKMPNSGINISTVSVGMAYIFKKLPALIHDTIPPVRKKMEYSFVTSAGLKERYPVGGDKYVAYSIMIDAAKIISHKCKIGAGIDLFYSTSLTKDNSSIDRFNNLQQGFHIAFQLMISKLSLLFNKGIYVYGIKDNGLFYHRIGVRYAINKHLLANISLKTHFFKADVIEFGVGYSVKSKGKS